MFHFAFVPMFDLLHLSLLKIVCKFTVFFKHGKMTNAKNNDWTFQQMKKSVCLSPCLTFKHGNPFFGFSCVEPDPLFILSLFELVVCFIFVKNGK